MATDTIFEKQGQGMNLPNWAMLETEEQPKSTMLAQEKNQLMEKFLGNIEKKAYRMAEISTSNRDDALELVQDAMISLVKNYSNRTEEEWRPLFYRILRSKLTDWHRKQFVRRKVMVFNTWLRNNDTQEQRDLIDEASGERVKEPDVRLSSDDTGEKIMRALKRLPPRQQQAFLLRAWEGFSVNETAQAMGCSEGSVKTHYSRANKSLQQQLATLHNDTNIDR